MTQPREHPRLCPAEHPEASSPLARTRMKRQRQRDTAPEIAIRRLLHAQGYRYRVDYPIPGLRRRVDLAFTAKRVAVLVDGCFWHACPIHGTKPKQNREWWEEKLSANVARDRDTDRYLTEHGWIPVRVWEHEEPADAVTRIVAALRSRQPPTGRDSGQHRVT